MTVFPDSDLRRTPNGELPTMQQVGWYWMNVGVVFDQFVVFHRGDQYKILRDTYCGPLNANTRIYTAAEFRKLLKERCVDVALG